MTIKMNEAEVWVARLANALIQSFRQTTVLRVIAFSLQGSEGKNTSTASLAAKIFSNKSLGLAVGTRDSSKVITICDNLPSMLLLN